MSALQLVPRRLVAIAVAVVVSAALATVPASADTSSTGEGAPPDAPRSFLAGGGREKVITFWWQPPLSDGGSPVTAYRVRKGAETLLEVGGDVTSGSLSPYWGGGEFTVVAVNQHGESAPSAPTNGSAWNTIPEQVKDLTARGRLSADGQSAEAHLSWTPSVADDVVRVEVYDANEVDYDLRYVDSRVRTNPIAVLAPDARSLVVRGLAPNATHAFYVLPVDDVGARSELTYTGLLQTYLRVYRWGATTPEEGKADTLEATLSCGTWCESGHLPGEVLTAWWRPHGAQTWSLLGPRTTSAVGKASWALSGPALDAEYQVRFDGGANAPAVTLPREYVPLVRTHVSRPSVRLGRTTTVRATVAPGQMGRYVHVQRKRNGRWVDAARVRLGSRSAMSKTVRPTARGYTTYRVRMPAAGGRAGAVGKPVRVRVR